MFTLPFFSLVIPAKSLPSSAVVGGGDRSSLLYESKEFRAPRESLFFERQRKITKRKPP
jgi:hypothetical protein